jgi:uncharacterized protein (TIGR02757 family)
MAENLKTFLERKVEEYNRPDFIKDDPISIPHLFNKKQDVEIAAFLASIFVWENRTIIIQKTLGLMQLMNMQPHAFILHHSPRELEKLNAFKHRTFNTTDLLYFIEFFRFHYAHHDSLEPAFSKWIHHSDETTENALNGFYDYCFSLSMYHQEPGSTLHHLRKIYLQTIEYVLRWMVRTDDQGVDFGIWNNSFPATGLPHRCARGQGCQEIQPPFEKQTDWLAPLNSLRPSETLTQRTLLNSISHYLDWE